MLKKWARDDYKLDTIQKAITSYHSIKNEHRGKLKF